MDLQKVGCEDVHLIELAQDRDYGNELSELNIKRGMFLTS